MRHGLQELQQLGVAVVRDPALLGKVVVVRGNELAHGHDARGLALQQVHYLTAELDKLRVADGALAAVNPRLWRSSPILVANYKLTMSKNLFYYYFFFFKSAHRNLVPVVYCGSTL